MAVLVDVREAVEVRVDLVFAPRRGIKTEKAVSAETLQAGRDEVSSAVTRCTGDNFRSGL